MASVPSLSCGRQEAVPAGCCGGKVCGHPAQLLCSCPRIYQAMQTGSICKILQRNSVLPQDIMGSILLKSTEITLPKQQLALCDENETLRWFNCVA